MRIRSCKLSGPSPASVCALTVMPYSVHFSRFSRRYGELSGEIPSILFDVLLPSVVAYWMEYPVMMPFWNSTGGGAQLTRTLVELGLVHLMSWGGAEGTDWPVLRRHNRGCLGKCYLVVCTSCYWWVERWVEKWGLPWGWNWADERQRAKDKETQNEKETLENWSSFEKWP